LRLRDAAGRRRRPVVGDPPGPGGGRRPPPHPPGLRAGHGGGGAAAGASLRNRPGGVRAAGRDHGGRGPLRLGGGRPRLRHRGQDLPRRAGPAAGPGEGRGGLWGAAARPGWGAAAKIFPGVLAPLLVLGMVPALGWWRSLLRTVPPFLAGFGLTVVPALALSVRGTADSVLYHVQRGVQVESLWANLIGVAHLFGLPAHTIYGFGAYD